MPLDLTSCETEPIHIPGFIQPHGVLVAVNAATFLIDRVSENSNRLLGLEPGELIGHSPALFFGEQWSLELMTALAARPLENVVSQVRLGPRGETLECVSSRSGSSFIMELQPIDGAHSLDPLDVSLSLQAPLARMERTASVVDLLQTVAREIYAISGFARVMVYRFDEDWHGVVLVEEVGDRLPVSYVGLHFPASDIPAQARGLYLLNTLRLIPDSEYIPVPIVEDRDLPTLAPLDLSRSDLRSVSPLHLQYLRNMGVRATLTISIVVRGKLWGLVACHHDAPRRLNHAVRSTCNFFAQMLALKLTARLDHTELSARLSASERLVAFVANLESTQSLWHALRANWQELLAIFAADGLLVRSPDGIAIYGALLPAQELEPALLALRAAATDGIASSSALYRLHDDARRFASEVSGALYIGLSHTDDRCLVILRREHQANVKWAGDPNKAAQPGAIEGRLSPRASFAVWEENTHCESDRWTAGDLQKAVSLRDQLIHWQHARDEVRFLAHYDALTELPNRRLLDELLKRSLSEADAENRLVAVLFIDIDRFKRFNDRLGHAAGDSVLRQVAMRLSRGVREGDIVGRLGGDEFVVLMPALLDRAAAEGVAQRLLDEISRPIPGIDGPDLRVTLSIGISLYPSDGLTSEVLLSKADAAMYRVKSAGRGAWQSYQSAQSGPPADASERVLRVSHALDRGEIVAHFQPVVDLLDERVVAFEALARWNHPVSGLLGPGAFIDIAEQSDLILRLGETMLDQSCRQVSRWRRTLAPSLRVAVNVSPRQLHDFGFVKTVHRILERYHLPPEALELEITEGMVAGDTSQSINALHELAGSGVRIAIDDFGTGYSSFNYLRRLPVTSLKIDQSFIAELRVPKTHGSGAVIIGAIISMAKSLGLEVIGEGVETVEQLELLRAAGCDFVQGYYFSRPLSAAAFTTFVLRAAPSLT